MLNPESLSREISPEKREAQKEWQPEEDKEFPEYILRRFEALNCVHNLEIEKLNTLLKENPSLKQRSLILYLDEWLDELRKTQKEIDPKISRAIVILLQELVGDEGPLVRGAAATALGNLGKEGLETLQGLAGDEEPGIRRDTAFALGNPGELGLEIRELETLRKLARDESPGVRQAAITALGNLGEAGLPTLQELAGDENPEVRKATATALGNLGEAGLETLQKLVRDEDHRVRQAVATALGKLGREGLATLQKLAEDEDFEVRQATATALGSLGEAGLEILQKLARDKYFRVRRDTVLALGRLGKEGKLGEAGLKILQELARDEGPLVRGAVATALGNLGKEGLETLQGLARDRDPWVRQATAIALGNLGEAGLVTLQELARDEEPEVHQTAFYALAKIKLSSPGIIPQLIKSLIVREEPFLANPLVEEIYHPAEEEKSPIFKLYDIIKELKEEIAKIKKKQPELDPNLELIGLSVLGSLSKGYWLPTSDLDWGLIWKAPPGTKSIVEEITQSFKEKAKDQGFKLCFDHSVNIASISTQTASQLEIIFNGLFLGDRQALKQAQSQVLNSCTQEQWEEIRRVWKLALDSYSKMIGRFGLSKEEVNRIQILREFLWSLPDFETAKQQFVRVKPETGSI